MNVAEKKDLRKMKLSELYNHNEKTGGRDAHIRFSDLTSNEENKQEHLAYEYLAYKGLIHYKINANNNYYLAKITSYGIDLIEDEN